MRDLFQGVSWVRAITLVLGACAAVWMPLVVAQGDAPPSTLAVSGLVASPDVSSRVALRPLQSNYDRHRDLLAGGTLANPVTAEAVADHGRFRIFAPSVGLWTVDVAAAGRVPMRYVPLPVTQPRELPPIELVPDVGVELRVRWETGEPVADAWVLLSTESAQLWRPAGSNGWQVGSRLGRTDAAGRVRLPRRSGEALEAHVFAAGARTSVLVAGDVSELELSLPWPGSRRTFVIEDQRGSPVADAIVTAGRPPWPVAISGPEGRVSIPVSAEGPFGLLLADGRRFDFESLPEPESEGAPGVIPWPGGSLVEGRVLAADTGRPLGGVLVWPGDDPGAFTFTDEQGLYRLASRQPRQTWVQAETRGFRPRAENLPVLPGAHRVPTLALEPAVALEGRVVDSAGTPLPGAVVTVEGSERAGYKVFWRDSVASRGVSDRAGRFQLPGLAPQATYRVAVRRSGFLPTRSTVRRGGPLQLTLARARSAHGSVRDRHGRGLGGIEVTVRPARSTRGPAGENSVRVTTAETGRFEIPAVPAAEVDVVLRGAGFAPRTIPGLVLAPGDGPVDLGEWTLLPGSRIAGWVTDPEDRPLPDTEIWMSDEDRPPDPPLARALRRQPPSTTSDRAGRFVLQDLPAGRRVHLLFARQGHLPAWVRGVETAPEDDELLSVVLESAHRLRGRVESEEREPVAGAKVRLRPAPPPVGTVGLEVQSSTNFAELRSELDGTFEFTEVAPGKALVEVLAEGFLPGEPVAVEIPQRGSPGELQVILRRGARVEGQVTDSRGKPVAGARLRIGPARGATDAEGRYRLTAVALGVKALLVTHPAYTRAVREIEVSPGTNFFDLTLDRGRTVSGRVVDPAGRPYPGATVILSNRGDRGPRAYRATADGDGRFRIQAVVDGRFDLATEASGFARSAHPEIVEVAGADVEGIELILARGATLYGQLHGVEADRVAEVELTVEKGDRLRIIGRVDHRGRFTIPHLEAGDWFLRARLAGGRREAGARVTIGPGERRVKRDLHLDGGIRLSGLVLFEDQPLVHAHVRVVRLDGEAVERSVTTGYRGTFRVEGLDPGHHRVEVVHAERMLSQSEDMELTADREVVLEITPAVLTGTVVASDTGEAIRDALVYLQRFLGGVEPGPLTTVGTDAAGSFLTASLAPGRYRLTVRATGYAPAQQQVEVAEGTPPEPLLIELSPTEGLGLTVHRRDGLLSNRVKVLLVDDAGRAVHQEDVLLSARGTGYLSQAPPGHWTLVVTASDAAPALVRASLPGERVEVVLEPAAPLTVRIPALIEVGGRAQLTITAEDGRPFVGVDPDGSLRHTWILNAGAVSISGLPAGRWHLRATSADGAVWTTTVTTTGRAPAQTELQ